MTIQRISIALAFLSLTLLAACGSNSSHTKSATGGALTFVAYGGTSQQHEVQVFAQPYAAAHHLHIVQDTTDYGKLYAMENAHHVTWDVVNVEGWFARQACQQGKAARLNPAVVPAAKDLPARAQSPCSIAPWSLSYVLGWNTKLVKGTPTSWADFFNTKKFPGKRGVSNVDSSGLLEAALMADGVPANRVYPMDYRHAFSKAATIKSDLVFGAGPQEVAQQLATGQTAMAIVTASRVVNFKNQGAPLAWTWKGQVVENDAWLVPKDAPHLKSAMGLLGSMLSTPSLVQFAHLNYYGPNTFAGVRALSKDHSCKLINTCAANTSTAVYEPDGWWLTHNKVMTDAWNKFVSG